MQIHPFHLSFAWLTNRCMPVILGWACLAGPAQSSWAQGEWVRQSPFPSPPQSTPYQIGFASPFRGYITGMDSVLLETTDGGETWHERDLNNNNQLNAVFFVDGQHGWLAGNGFGSMYRTLDGGATWQSLTGVGGSTYHIDFVSSTHGWIGGNGGLYRTTDGGQTWNHQPFAPGLQAQAGGVDFINEQVGLASQFGSGNDLRRTVDGGQTWSIVYDEPVSRVIFVTPTIALADTPSDFIRSVDGGLTWTPVETSGALLRGPWIVNESTLVAFDYLSGDGWRSIDAGVTWSKVFEGPQLNFVGADFVTPSRGFAVGSEGLIIRSDDAGATWAYASSGTSMELAGIEMLDAQRGVACGDMGTVLTTSDGGQHWLPARPGMEVSYGGNLMNVTTVAPSFFAAAGDYGTIIKSLDAGATWQHVQGPGAGTGDVWAIEFITPDQGWLGHTMARIYHTPDGGETWTLQFDPGGASGDAVYDIHFLDEQHGWAVGTFSGVFRTVDGGANWTWVHFTSPGLREVEFVNPSVGWAVGYINSAQGYIAKSVNGGLTWQPQVVPPSTRDTQFILSLDAVSENEAWAATQAGQVMHTTDGGATWVTVDTGFNGNFDGYFGMCALPTGDVWLAGFRGTIIRRVGENRPVAGDVNGDGAVDVDDLIAVILGWGPCADCKQCPADVNDDCAVDVDDLITVILSWA